MKVMNDFTSIIVIIVVFRIVGAILKGIWNGSKDDYYTPDR